VNEASTIIQSAAHEDANIIFGAVLDEKMKDEVKITVIATGFKEQYAHRTQRVNAAAAAISHTRSAAVHHHHPEPVVTARHEPTPAAEPEIEEMHVPEPARVPERVAVAPQREERTLQQVTSTVTASYEADDLDVPAFLRKKS
jgi:cell division protein FtsZ